jgi:hypothetical protein
LVAEKIQSIIESGTWQLRHPVGPGAEPLLESRKATSDEDYIAFHGLADDDAWYAIMEQRDRDGQLRPKATIALTSACVGIGTPGVLREIMIS